jgi:putative transport protein
MTQSAALGTGLSAIAELPLDAVEKAKLVANAPLADAITYGFGDLGLILFLTWLGPMIMRADLRREAKALEAKLAGDARPADKSPVPQYGIRAYRVENAQMAGTTLASLEQRYADDGCRCSGSSAAEQFLPIASTLTFDRGDRVVVSAGSPGVGAGGREHRTGS